MKSPGVLQCLEVPHPLVEAVHLPPDTGVGALEIQGKNNIIF